MMIRKAETKDIGALGELASRLWPHHSPEEMAGEYRELMEYGEAACFLAFLDGAAVGFAQCQLRHDYVEGTSSSPVGYLEGIYVEDSARNRGLAGKLLAACENWARQMGCLEFASDCELDNRGSLAFHLRLGFEEAGRIICFTKKL